MERKISEYIMKKVREMSDYDENDKSHDVEILTYNSKKELFDKFLRYEGIIGYSSRIIEVIEELWNIDLELLDEDQ